MDKVKGKKIRILSTFLKNLCKLGIVIFPLLTFVYWIFGRHQIQILHTNWYIQFSDPPPISLNNLTMKMKLIGAGIDLISCAFFVTILFLLAELFGHFERLYFFSKSNIRLIRWVAFILLLKTLIHPFYLAARSFIFTPTDESPLLVLFGPSEFKSLIIIFGIFLLAYIMEAAWHIEQELIDTI